MAQAAERPGGQETFEAAADLTTFQFHAVVINSSGKLAAAGAGVSIIGVLQNKPAAANRAAGVMLTGTTKAVAGATLDEGQRVEVNASSRFIPLASGVAVGTVETPAAANGEMFTLNLDRR